MKRKILPKSFVYNFIKKIFIHFTPLLLCVGVSNAYVLKGQDFLKKEAKLTIKEKSIKDIFTEIEFQTHISFLYSPTIIEENRKVTLPNESRTIAETLNQILTPNNISYRVFGNQIILSKNQNSNKPLPNALASLETYKNKSDLTIQGKITDAKNQEALPGATIVIKNTTIGTTTDINGNYTIKVPEKSAILVFSLVGYIKQEITVGNQTKIDVQLTADTKALEEVVVVGYGQQTKVSITNAVAAIKGAELTKRPVSSMQQALQGQVAGLTIMDQGGSPGRASSVMRVRGVTTLSGNNDALIIVDGIEQQLTNINPNDIENISVLKDAASTAIYGSRAANGVILVTTKRAAEGKLKVDYNMFYALQHSTNNPKMDMPSYMKLEQVAYTNAGIALPNIYTDQGIKDYISGNKTNPERYPYVNEWFQNMLKYAPQINNNLSVSGGNKTIRARLGFRYQDQSSIFNVPTNYGSKLYDIRINTDYNLSSKLILSTDINYRNVTSTAPYNETDIFNRFWAGTLFATPKYTDVLEHEYPGITGTYGLSSQGVNPRMKAEIGGNSKRVYENIYLGFKAQYTLSKNLNFISQLSIRKDNASYKDFANAFTNVDLVKNVKSTNLINSLSQNYTYITEYTWNNYLNYNQDFGKNNLKGLLGYSTINNQFDTLSVYRQRFYNNDLQSINQGANDGTKNNGGFSTQFGIRSYFARINYNFKDKYLFEANGRYDGSSRFTGNNVYSFFPSFSAGWRISEEKFMKSFPFEELKARASWGKTGNQSVGLYSYYQTLSPNPYGFNGAVVTSYSPSILSNKNITWETTEQIDLGMDVLVFKNFSFTFDYYKKTTYGILLYLPIPTSIGLLAPPQNAGKVLNTGIELQLGYRKSINRDLKFNTMFNFSKNKNKVLNLAGTGPYISGRDIDPLYITQEGLPINSFWGYKTDGLFQTLEQVKNYPNITTGRGPGDVKYVDLNGDGVIDAKDRTVIGNSFPNFMYSFNAAISYKKFELTLFFQGVSGVDTRLAGPVGEFGNNEGFVPKLVSTNYWTPENPNARFPRPLKRDLFNIYSSDRMIINGDYLRLKNLQLLAWLPESWSNKIKISKANVYFSATNLITFSKLKEWGLDPEIPSGRGIYYPQISVLTLGTNIQF